MSIELMPPSSFNDDDIYFWEPATKIIRRTIGCSDARARHWGGSGKTTLLDDRLYEFTSGLRAKHLGLYRINDLRADDR